MNPSHNNPRGLKPEMNPDVELETLARAEQLRVIFKHGAIVFLANLSGGVTLVAGLWAVAPRHQLLAWLLILVLLSLARWVKGRQLARQPVDPATVGRQDALLVSGTLLSGLVWGSAALLFYLHGQPQYGLFLALILVAMTAASIVLLAFHPYAYLVFCMPVVIPLAIELGLDQGAAQMAIALVMPIYYSLLIILSRQIYQFTHEAIVNSLVRERHALIDQLTAIPNRRAFEEFLEREWIRGIRSGRPLSLILCDVDEFKTYNDRYGHAVGDSILRSVAGLFRQAARRRTDLAARIGGDEFAMIAPETGASGVVTIVRGIEESRDALAQGTFGTWRFPSLSFGVCTVTPSDSASVFELFEAADAALYKAKRAGRGRSLDGRGS